MEEGSLSLRFAQPLKESGQGRTESASLMFQWFSIFGQEPNEINRGKCGWGTGWETNKLIPEEGWREQGGQGLESFGICLLPSVGVWVGLGEGKRVVRGQLMGGCLCCLCVQRT